MPAPIISNVFLSASQPVNWDATIWTAEWPDIIRLAGGMPGMRPPMGPPPDQARMPDGSGLAFGFDSFGAASTSFSLSL
jgi:hypothetical protein